MKIRLRNIRVEDLEQIIQWRMSPEITKHMYTDPILTLESQMEWYKRIESDSSCKYWIIEVENVSIGIVSIIDIDKKNRKFNRQWYIGNERYLGKGISKIVQFNINDYCFNNLNMNKQYCEVLASNSKAINVNLKLGFRIEGELESHIYKYEEFLDVILMAITRSRWEKLRHQLIYPEIEIEE